MADETTKWWNDFFPNWGEVADRVGLELGFDDTKEEMKGGILDLLSSIWDSISSVLGWSGTTIATLFNDGMDWTGDFVADTFLDKPEHTAGIEYAEKLDTLLPNGTDGQSAALTDITKERLDGFGRMADGEKLSARVSGDIISHYDNNSVTYTDDTYSYYKTAFNDIMAQKGVDLSVLGEERTETLFKSFTQDTNAQEYVAAYAQAVADSVTSGLKPAIENKTVVASIGVPTVSSNVQAKLTAAYASLESEHNLQEDILIAEMIQYMPDDFRRALSREELVNFSKAYLAGKQGDPNGMTAADLQNIGTLQTQDPTAFAHLLSQVDDNQQAAGQVTELEDLLSSQNMVNIDFTKVPDGKAGVVMKSGRTQFADIPVDVAQAGPPTATPAITSTNTATAPEKQ